MQASANIKEMLSLARIDNLPRAGGDDVDNE